MSSQQLLSHSPVPCAEVFPCGLAASREVLGVLCHCCLVLDSRPGPSLQRRMSHSLTAILASAVRNPSHLSLVVKLALRAQILYRNSHFTIRSPQPAT